MKKNTNRTKFLLILGAITILILVTVGIVSNLTTSTDSRTKADNSIVCHSERLMWMWNTRRKEEWSAMKVSGANTVSVEGNEGRKDPTVMNADLNYLTSLNLKGIVHLDTLFDAQNILDANYQNKVKEYINAIKNNDAIYGYFLADEPDIGRRLSADKVRKLNEVVKSVDSTRPTILNYFTVFSGEVKEYIGTADIEGIDYYAWSGDANGTWRASTIEFRTFISKFIDYYNDLQTNNTKENFLFIQAYKWTPGDIQPSTNVNYVPTYDNLNNLLSVMKEKSEKYKAHAYYYWSSENSKETTLDTVPELLTAVSQLSSTWKNDYGQFPVRIGCEPTQNTQVNSNINLCINSGGNWEQFPNGCADNCSTVQNRYCTQAITSSCNCGEGACWNGSSCVANPVITSNSSQSSNSSSQETVNLTCNSSNIENQCRVQFYTNLVGQDCFKIFSLNDCKIYNDGIQPRYIVYGGNNNTNPVNSASICQNNENIISSGELVEGKEYCANIAGTDYKYNQIDFNIKIKYSIDENKNVSIDKCNSGGIAAGGVCTSISTMCSKYDLNSDGKVDILNDFLAFSQQFGKTGNLNADFNSDNIVDVKDFLFFKEALYKYFDTKSCNL